MVTMINGKTYKTVIENNREWLNENLDLETEFSYINEAHPEYGRFYKANAIDLIEKLLFDGWRIPTSKDFYDLEWEFSYGKLKSIFNPYMTAIDENGNFYDVGC